MGGEGSEGGGVGIWTLRQSEMLCTIADMRCRVAFRILPILVVLFPYHSMFHRPCYIEIQFWQIIYLVHIPWGMLRISILLILPVTFLVGICLDTILDAHINILNGALIVDISWSPQSMRFWFWLSSVPIFWSRKQRGGVDGLVNPVNEFCGDFGAMGEAFHACYIACNLCIKSPYLVLKFVYRDMGCAGLLVFLLFYFFVASHSMFRVAQLSRGSMWSFWRTLSWHQFHCSRDVFGFRSISDILFLFFWSGYRDQIACLLLGGFSNPRIAATQSLSSFPN